MTTSGHIEEGPERQESRVANLLPSLDTSMGQQLVERLPRLLQLLDYHDTKLRAELAMHAGIIGDADDDVELRLTQGESSFNQFLISTRALPHPQQQGKGGRNPPKARALREGNGKTIEGLVNRRKAGAEMFVG
jgi:hypothetical protein